MENKKQTPQTTAQATQAALNIPEAKQQEQTPAPVTVANTPAIVPPKKDSIKSLLNRDDVKQKFQEMLGKKAQGFITSVLQIANSNTMLAGADPYSIYNAAATAATLDLPLNNNLGFAYIVPYNQSYKDGNGAWQKKAVAQFQMGYKGFIQLAQRTGLFKTISSTPVYEGQIVTADPLTGYVFDFTQRKSETCIGYAAFFKLLNGFEKTLYMTIEEITKHGAKYSQSFGNAKGLWKTDFDAMATKTVLKLLLAKFAPLSIEMQIQKAITVDQSVINDPDANDVTYVDHVEVVVDKEVERMEKMIDDCETVAELLKLQPDLKPEQQDYFNAAFDNLMEKEATLNTANK